MENIKYFCDSRTIEKKAKIPLEAYAKQAHIQEVCAFTDIHYCDEKAIPVGVAFSTKDYFYPLVTGKDVGCGVLFLKISKADWIKPFDKNAHYKGFEFAHNKMTDDGLGGGNHFLSIEEDANHIYLICHTGTRNRGIALYQQCVGMVQDYSAEYGQQVSFLPRDYVGEKFYAKYEETLQFAYQRRKNFCMKTLLFLQTANYINCEKHKIPKDYLKQDFSKLPERGKLYGTAYEMQDSIHNFLQFKEDGTVIHRKGSTGLQKGKTVVIPLSMTRGSLLVKVNANTELTEEALWSCAHGAGRKLSRFNAMKYWRNTLKAKERKAYYTQFPELLDRSRKFSSGYIQEFDFAYKDHSDIFKYQSYLKKVTTTKPIVTVKYTEI